MSVVSDINNVHAEAHRRAKGAVLDFQRDEAAARERSGRAAGGARGARGGRRKSVGKPP